MDRLLDKPTELEMTKLSKMVHEVAIKQFGKMSLLGISCAIMKFDEAPTTIQLFFPINEFVVENLVYPPTTPMEVGPYRLSIVLFHLGWNCKGCFLTIEDIDCVDFERILMAFGANLTNAPKFSLN